ncbi:MAG: isoprenylcysteine carboxylmethyltransferase family protein [Candidatus Spechtbacterales bacterium]
MIAALALSALLFEGVRIWKFAQKAFAITGVASIRLFAADLLLVALIVFQFFNPDVGKMPIPETMETPIQLVGLVFAVTGSVFASWARIYMGANWRTVWDRHQQDKLIIGGPWKICRHPIYAGTWLFGVGFELALQNWLFFGAIAMIVIISRIAKREDKYLESRFGDEWREYAEQTPELIPGIR